MFNQNLISSNPNNIFSNGIIILDEDGVIIYTSPSIDNILSLRTNILGWKIKDVLNISESLDDLCFNKAILLSSSEADVFCHFYKFENIIGHTEDSSSFFYIISITDGRLFDSAYIEFKEIVDDFFDGVLITDENANVQYINESYTRNTGTPISEYLGNNLRDFLNPIYFKQSAAILAAQERTTVSLHHTTPNNNNIIATGTPIFDKNGDIKRITVVTHNLSEIYSLRDEILKSKNEELLHFANLQKSENSDETLIVVSEIMQNIYIAAKRLSNFDTTVLVTGPSGAGKEEIAKYIHNNSPRKFQKFVAINCNTLNDNLLESELFGYVGGTFTGANKNGKAGLFEKTNGGTLFLDEIGDITPSFQAKLLRVLETKKISRIGSVDEVPVNVRIIAATNKDLQQMVLSGAFRDDLFYRLNIVQIKVPPLKERLPDLQPLTSLFLKRFNEQYGQSKKMTPEVLDEMSTYEWPGNIRELKNVIENIVVLSNNEFIQPKDLPWETRASSAIRNYLSGTRQSPCSSWKDTIEKVEIETLIKAREVYGSTRKMSSALQLDQATIVRKMKKYGLS